MMNYQLIAALAMASGLFACQKQAEQQQDVDSVAANAAADQAVAEEIVAATSELVSGLDFDGFDTAVRPQDDLFAAVNGKWVAETELPADRARWGTFDMLRDQSEDDVKALVEEVSPNENVGHGSATQKIRDFYNAYMDAETATNLVLAPFAPSSMR